MTDERIHGLTLADCAEIMAKDGALKAQHGERAYKSLFDRWLGERGVDESTWANAWNGWWTRMQADPSGQLHARFNALQREHHLAAHHADVRDASGDAKEGVTLDTYAELMARAAGGEDMQAVVASAGLSWDQWQKAQAAWNAAMAADVDHHLTTQYGQLYAKHMPGFEQQMQGQVAAAMAAEHAMREAGVPDEPDEEYELDDMVRELSHPTPRTRWTAAHHVANAWDVGERDDAELQAAARRAVEVARECLGAFDLHTVSEAAAAAEDLKMFASQGFFDEETASDVKGDLERALSSGRDQLADHRAAFEPVRDKAVPERVRLQMAVQDFESFVEEAEAALEDWDDDLELAGEATDEEPTVSPPVMEVAPVADHQYYQ